MTALAAAAVVVDAPAPRRTPSQLLRILRLEARAELLKAARLPAYALPTISFPVVFYLLFGIAFGSGAGQGARVATYLLATYGAFGVIGAALFALGIGLAVERGQGWMLLKRATPMPPVLHFLGRVAVGLVFGAIIVAAQCALGAAFGGVELAPARWAELVAILLAGVVPFSAMGLALGYLAGPNSAPAIVNLIYLPMAFASGLWLPLKMLPAFLQDLAPWLPPYHYARLALRPVGMGDGDALWPSVLYLALFTVAALAVGVWGYRRDAGRTYG